MRSLLTCVVSLFLVALGTARADEWPGWRGPRGDGVSDDSNVPLRWSRTENVRWKVAVPGRGHSSPVVWGDRVFVTSCREKEQERVLLCYDRRDGKLLWQRVVLTAPLEKLHGLNSHASSTPATDGRHVFVTFLADPHVRVVCYDFNGNRVWDRSPGTFSSRHGFCSSPCLYKDLVIVNADQDADGYLVALDRATGAERWRTARPNQTRSYCPPVVFDVAGRKQLVLTGSKCAAGYDPDTGRQNWIVDGPTEQFVASMVERDGLVFLTAGFPTYHVMAIRPDGSGNVTTTHVVWHDATTKTGAAYVPSPIVHGKSLYVVSDEGWLNCFDAATGRRRWKERLGRHHSASPVSAGGYLFFLDDSGETWVLHAGDKLDVVARNKLGEECRGSPAVAHGQLFIRTLEHLYCISTGDRSEAAR
jgi:outer membrane protein assembly factor BamB